MHRDSVHGLTIDLAGEDGNVFSLIGHAKGFCKELSMDFEKIMDDMTSSDYAHAVDVFAKKFPMVTLLNKPD